MGVMNVAYVWQAHGGNTPDIQRWYPGDSYVNWVGYSHFNESNPGENILDFAEAHDKPVMIAEAAPKVDLKTGSGTDHWNNWFGPLFEILEFNLWQDSIVGTVEPDREPEGELIVTGNVNRLIIRASDDALLNPLSAFPAACGGVSEHLWDYFWIEDSSRLAARSFNYTIPAGLITHIPVLVLHVQKGELLIRKKAVLI